MECTECGRKFRRTDVYRRHKRIHDQAFVHCEKCSYRTTRPDNLSRHKATYHAAIEQIEQPVVFDETKVKQTERRSPVDEETNKPTSLEQDGDSEDEKLIKINQRWIRTYKVVGKRMQDRFNFQLDNPTTSDLMGCLDLILKQQTHPFKLNISFGFILKNTVTEARQYYYASTNNRLFPSPIQITNHQDLELVRQRLDTEDLLEYCRAHRPDTKLVVQKITNCLFYVNKIKTFRIGCAVELPNYIKDLKCVVGLQCDNHGVRYTDNLCIFRCLACHRGYDAHSAQFRFHVTQLATSFLGPEKISTYQGIGTEEIPCFERHFLINVEVHSLDWDEEMQRAVVRRIYRSAASFHDTMHINHYRGHFSYIKNIYNFSDRWVCEKCDKLFRRYFNRNIHQRNCAEKTKIVYKSGGFGLRRSLFEQLHAYGINIPRPLRFYPTLVAFDMECMSVPIPPDDPIQGSKVNYNRELIPASFAICASTPGFTEPKCIISEGDPAALIEKLYDYLMEVSNANYAFLLPHYERIFEDIRNRISDIESSQTGTSDSLVGGLASSHEEPQSSPLVILLQKLGEELERWLRQIPVLGFNSGRFDVNLIRRYLWPYLISKDIDISNIIKKTNDHITFSTPHALFLDVKNYVSAGVSYAKWLEASDVDGAKFHWPHDWFDSLEKLDTPYLVPKDCFWSELHQEGISDEDYRKVKDVWTVKGFRTMRDLLIYYSYADVEPFVKAAEKLRDYWHSLDIEPFKGGCFSMPGLALTLLVMRMQPHTILPLFGEEDKDLFELVKKNIVGGLSVIIHRYLEVGQTILPEGSTCATIRSYDCNSQYLYAVSCCPIGTSLYYRWNPANDPGLVSPEWRLGQSEEMRMRWEDIVTHNLSLTFRRRTSFKYCAPELGWLEWLSSTKRVRLEHRFNGRQLVVPFSKNAKYAVDGFDPATHTIYQFHGCYWHGHGCELDTNRNREDAANRAEKTAEATANLESLGYVVEVMWECHWNEEKRNNPTLRAFLDYHLNLHSPNELTGFDIIRRVIEGRLFGLILCDCEVPWWDAVGVEKFREFPPIYKHASIPLSAIGEHMQEYAQLTGYMTKPRKCLINSYWGREILITTELLRWYLTHGLKVTRIYQFIEMKPKRCFMRIGKEVSENRREADRDERYKSVGETWKTVGNSLYGKMITNKNRHKNTKILGDDAIPFYVNDQRFHHLEEIGSTAYEVTMDKRRINQDLPNWIGLWVYCNSRQRMLEYIYDCIQTYFRPGSWMHAASDTDSLITGFASQDLDELIRPELKEQYLRAVKHKYFVTREEDRRTPGLFKVEWEGNLFLGTCSKTYIFCSADGESKLSTKGLSKRTNKFTKDDFLEVLATRTRGCGTNFGFKIFKDKLYQYSQERAGLSYLYVKREVLNDGVSTRPLQL